MPETKRFYLARSSNTHAYDIYGCERKPEMLMSRKLDTMWTNSPLLACAYNLEKWLPALECPMATLWEIAVTTTDGVTRIEITDQSVKHETLMH